MTKGVSLVISAESPYLPSGYCYLWDGPLVSLHVVSALIIGLAFVSIPVLLLWFVKKRRDVPFQGALLWFSAFLVACGAASFMEVWNLWHDAYWLAGVIQGVAAVAS